MSYLTVLVMISKFGFWFFFFFFSLTLSTDQEATEAQDGALPPMLAGGRKMQNIEGFIRPGGAEGRHWCRIYLRAHLLSAKGGLSVRGFRGDEMS